MYNYEIEMREDIKNYIQENDRTAANTTFNDLYDELWIADSVTGNGSGSYTFNSAEAAKNLMENDGLVTDALLYFDIDNDVISEKFLNHDYEYFDVTIRCYLLRSVLSDVWDEMVEEWEENGGEY